MTTRWSMIGMLGVMVLCVTVVAVTASRVATTRSQAASTQLALDQVVRDAQEVIDLRGKQQRVELRERPPQDVIAQVNAVLAEVGIPSKAMRSLTPESDSAMVSGNTPGDAKLKRQSVRLVLENLSIQEIGAFLLKWRSTQSIWTTTRIELAHVQGDGHRSMSESDSGKSSGGGGYDATLIISALYVDSPGADYPTNEPKTTRKAAS